MKLGVRNGLVLAVTTLVIVSAVLLVKQPWRQTSDVSVVSVTKAPGAAAPAVDALATDFTAQTLTGDTVTLSALRGKPVWLVFGATWCPTCRHEVATLQALSQEYAGRIDVVAVYVQEGRVTVQNYATAQGLTYTQIPDPGDVISPVYAITGLPTHFFIDSHGVIRQIVVGGIDKSWTTQMLDYLLAI